MNIGKDRRTGTETEGEREKKETKTESFRRVICLIHKAVKTTGEERRGKMENGELERRLISN